MFSMCFRISYNVIVTKEKIKQYAILSGDDNPIHSNQTEANQQGFKKPIAHGLLTMGLIMNVASPLIERGMRISSYELQFIKPVLEDESIEITAEATSIRNYVQVNIMGSKVSGNMVLHL